MPTRNDTSRTFKEIKKNTFSALKSLLREVEKFSPGFWFQIFFSKGDSRMTLNSSFVKIGLTRIQEASDFESAVQVSPLLLETLTCTIAKTLDCIRLRLQQKPAEHNTFTAGRELGLVPTESTREAVHVLPKDLFTSQTSYCSEEKNWDAFCSPCVTWEEGRFDLNRLLHFSSGSATFGKEE